MLTRLKQSYDPPGHLRKDGPRHDNDGVEISTIQIIPTHAEMLCPVPPYVPVTLPDAPHHCRKDSMERLLDVQFRLLREELVYASLAICPYLQNFHLISGLQCPRTGIPLDYPRRPRHYRLASG